MEGGKPPFLPTPEGGGFRAAVSVRTWRLLWPWGLVVVDVSLGALDAWNHHLAFAVLLCGLGVALAVVYQRLAVYKEREWWWTRPQSTRDAHLVVGYMRRAVDAAYEGKPPHRAFRSQADYVEWLGGYLAQEVAALEEAGKGHAP